MSVGAQNLTAQQTLALILPGQVYLWSPGLLGADGQPIAPTEASASHGIDWQIIGPAVAFTNNTGISQAGVFLKATRQHSDELQLVPTNAGALVLTAAQAIPSGAKAIFQADSEVAALAAPTLPSALGLVNQLGVTVLAGVVTIPDTNANLAGVYEARGSVSLANLNVAAQSCLVRLRDTTSGTIYWSGQNLINIAGAETIAFHGFIEKAAGQTITLVVEVVPIAPAVLADFQLIGEVGEVALAWTLQKIA